MEDANLFTFIGRILDAYESIELSTAPHTYFVAVDQEQISERSKKTDIKKIIPETENLLKDEANQLASLLFLPGSNLPKLKPDEVEIARISVGTTIGNSFSLRAEWGDVIIYRMVSEVYRLEIEVPIKNSKTPLTLKEIILQFECAVPAVGLSDLMHEIREGDLNINRAQYLVAESAFYSGFKQFYRHASEKIIERESPIG